MFKSRADLLIAAGESIEIQEKAGIEPVFKLCGKQKLFNEFGPWFNDKLEVYEFPLAVVEGKPVFVGDELYDSKGGKIKLEGHEHLNFSCFSLNPPKPKTVIVPLLIEDAEWLASFHGDGHVSSAGKACRKALEETK